MTKKEELLQIEGVTDEIAEKVIESYKGWVPHERFNEINEAKKNAEALVKERDQQLETLKAAEGDIQSLKSQIEALQASNKDAADKYEAEIKRMKIDGAVSSALKDAGALNLKAARALLDLETAELNDDGTIKGLDDQIKALQKSDAFLFQTKEPANPKVVGASPAKGDVTRSAGGITKEQFATMGYKERVELFNTNRDAYDALTKN